MSMDETSKEFYEKYEDKLKNYKDRLTGLFADYDNILNCTKQELIDDYGLKKYEANIVWKCISQEIHDDEIVFKREQPPDECEPFDIPLTVGQTPYQITDVTVNTTIEQIKKKICMKIKGTEAGWDDITVSITNQSNVQNGDTLGQYHITDGVMASNVMSVITQLRGGTSNENERKEQYKTIWNHTKSRRLKLKKYPFLDPVKAVCDVFLCGTEMCNKMPCGHNISPMSCLSLIKRLLEKDLRSFKLKCPVLKENSSNKIQYCNKEWPWTMVRAVADLDDDEFEKTMEIVNKRGLQKSTITKRCPHQKCQRLCRKPDKLGIFRVACECGIKDWCWQCGKSWIASGFAICGNKDCETWRKQLRLLQCESCYDPNDDKNKKYQYKDLVIPKIRACPNCFSIISHKTACKHMTCAFCTNKNRKPFEFCFLCLTIKKNGVWQGCDNPNYWSVCKVAPIQLLGGGHLDYPKPKLTIKP